MEAGCSTLIFQESSAQLQSSNEEARDRRITGVCQQRKREHQVQKCPASKAQMENDGREYWDPLLAPVHRLTHMCTHTERHAYTK